MTQLATPATAVGTASQFEDLGRDHAASVIALADTSCGYGCQVSLPDAATGMVLYPKEAS